MIKISDKGDIQYEISHLIADRVATYDEIIDRLENINTDLFYNVVSDPKCYYEKNYSDGRIREDIKNMDAEKRFQNILTTGILHGNPKSYFVNKNKKQILSSSIDEIISVSFALSDIKSLEKHFDARGSEFAFCFFHDFLQNKGLREVKYLNNIDVELRESLIFNSPHLIEVFSQYYDKRWEQEWRIKGDLEFDSNDIAFVVVPEAKYEYYVTWCSDRNYKFKIVTSSTFTNSLEHLLFLPKMDNAWRQVRIGGGEDGGFKQSPEDLPEMDATDIMDFKRIHLRALECLAKNTLLSCYEQRYTDRFFSFVNKIETSSISGLISNIANIRANYDEPSDSERDLVNSLFTGIWQILAKNGRLKSL